MDLQLGTAAYSTTVRTTLSSTASFENLTVGLSSTVSTTPSETITKDRITTMPATQSKMPTTHFTIPSTAQSIRSTTQKCTSTAQLSSSEMIYSDSTITDVKEITMEITTETMPIMVTTILPTISTTLVRNGTSASEILADTTSIIPLNATSKMTNTITVETDRTTITTTTVKDTMTNTSVIVSETTLTKTTIPMFIPKCTKGNMTIHCTKSIALEFDYIVRDIETGIACILTNMMIRINLRYAMKDSQIGNATLTVPTNAKITGICNEKIAEMTLSWKESDESQVDGDNNENRITFYYAHNETKFFLDFISIDVHLDGNNFPRAQKERMRGDTADRHLQLFSASMKYGIFICKVNTTINIGDQIGIVISDIRLIAFNECIQNCSKTGTDCIAETSANIDTIGTIGGVLIGIVILILILRKWRSKKKNSKKPQDTANYFLSREKVVIKKWI